MAAMNPHSSALRRRCNGLKETRVFSALCAEIPDKFVFFAKIF